MRHQFHFLAQQNYCNSFLVSETKSVMYKLLLSRKIRSKFSSISLVGRNANRVVCNRVNGAICLRSSYSTGPQTDSGEPPKTSNKKDSHSQSKIMPENSNVNSNQSTSSNGSNGAYPPQKRSAVESIFGPKAFAMFAVAAVGLYFLFKYKKEKAKEEVKQSRTVGKALLGGPFTLVDHNGHPTTEAAYRGKFILIYFGFTFCPDICPAELNKLSKVIQILEEKGWGNAVVPLFISVDPWRDNVAAVREYIRDFHPKFIGLTGTPEQVTSAAKQFRVYTSRPPNAEDEGKGDYLVDHSVISYLVDPEGDFTDYYGQDMEPEIIAERIFNCFESFLEKHHTPTFVEKIVKVVKFW